MTINVTIPQAKEQFNQLLNLVLNGEEITIYDDNQPVAYIMPNHSSQSQRIPGQDRGKIWMAPDFNNPLEDESLVDFID
jgi:antitoxin (DNA-binding transcriptional repressor) of toxin-antitoxin stability system